MDALPPTVSVASCVPEVFTTVMVLLNPDTPVASLYVPVCDVVIVTVNTALFQPPRTDRLPIRASAPDETPEMSKSMIAPL